VNAARAGAGLDGAAVFVTGGASGLGEAVVRMVASGGGHAAILDLPGSRGAALARSLGSNAAFFEVDVSVPEQVERAVDGAAERFGHVDVLVNCAGISPVGRTLDRSGRMLALEVFRRTIDVNLVGLYDVVRHTARHMARNEPDDDGTRGLIVNTASIAGYEGQSGQAAYAASKGAIIALTLPLARDLAIWGIRVMAIAPGIMDTGMFSQFTPEQREAMARLHLFPQRIGRPDEFAQLVRACIDNRMLNGEVVRLDAGARLA
jgi:3-hydroxyacyl-CoA dehydrogenase/3-hydroxy-2-methylbutyryl-CoA dehydrogenase